MMSTPSSSNVAPSNDNLSSPDNDSTSSNISSNDSIPPLKELLDLPFWWQVLKRPLFLVVANAIAVKIFLVVKVPQYDSFIDGRYRSLTPGGVQKVIDIYSAFRGEVLLSFLSSRFLTLLFSINVGLVYWAAITVQKQLTLLEEQQEQPLLEPLLEAGKESNPLDTPVSEDQKVNTKDAAKKNPADDPCIYARLSKKLDAFFCRNQSHKLPITSFLLNFLYMLFAVAAAGLVVLLCLQALLSSSLGNRIIEKESLPCGMQDSFLPGSALLDDLYDPQSMLQTQTDLPVKVQRWAAEYGNSGLYRQGDDLITDSEAKVILADGTAFYFSNFYRGTYSSDYNILQRQLPNNTVQSFPQFAMHQLRKRYVMRWPPQFLVSKDRQSFCFVRYRESSLRFLIPRIEVTIVCRQQDGLFRTKVLPILSEDSVEGWVSAYMARYENYLYLKVTKTKPISLFNSRPRARETHIYTLNGETLDIARVDCIPNDKLVVREIYAMGVRSMATLSGGLIFAYAFLWLFFHACHLPSSVVPLWISLRCLLQSETWTVIYFLFIISSTMGLLLSSLPSQRKKGSEETIKFQKIEDFLLWGIYSGILVIMEPYFLPLLAMVGFLFHHPVLELLSMVLPLWGISWFVFWEANWSLLGTSLVSALAVGGVARMLSDYRVHIVVYCKSFWRHLK